MSSVIKKTDNFPYFGSIFDDFFSKDVFDWNAKNFSQLGSTLPSVNVKETDNDFQVELAAPGMKKEDFKIELNNHILSISSEKSDEKEEKKEKYTRREFNYQSFTRSFRLPDSAAADGIAAAYKDGVLNVQIPKKEVAKTPPKQTIPVK
ncbi:MAG: Hsp20/alpha crystallin family protein [Bacteroidia bacterium]|jgi:HSP20 family protein|nr:Hsp20/alpha crystallin family protein [Bacteroidia bacterium]